MAEWLLEYSFPAFPANGKCILESETFEKRARVICYTPQIRTWFCPNLLIHTSNWQLHWDAPRPLEKTIPVNSFLHKNFRIILLFPHPVPPKFLSPGKRVLGIGKIYSKNIPDPVLEYSLQAPRHPYSKFRAIYFPSIFGLPRKGEKFKLLQMWHLCPKKDIIPRIRPESLPLEQKNREFWFEVPGGLMRCFSF